MPLSDSRTPVAAEQIKMGCDVKEWWLANAERFPYVERMARQYLGCTPRLPS